MRRTAGDWYCDDFLTIESGKTLTFIVKEFLNDFACKQGLRLDHWKGKEMRILRWNFTDRLYNTRFSAASWMRNSRSICWKHDWLAIDSSESWFHCQIDECSLKRRSLRGDWSHRGSTWLENAINYSLHPNYIALTVKLRLCILLSAYYIYITLRRLCSKYIAIESKITSYKNKYV